MCIMHDMYMLGPCRVNMGAHTYMYTHTHTHIHTHTHTKNTQLTCTVHVHDMPVEMVVI